MIKLQDFAKECGVTDRQIQRLLKKYAEECKGHYERKGPGGTWLDKECQQILRSHMKVKEIVLFDSEQQKRIKELEERIERKDVIIERLQEREGEKDQRIKKLESDQLLLEERKNEKINQLEESLQHEKERSDCLEKQLLEEKNKPIHQIIFERLFNK